jgi:ubiquinone/menaquinone biosynthesis C-methylase UbiE
MSISFDRIAARYDTTRGFPPGIDAHIGAAFRRRSGLPAGARLLEIGVGTGRIAHPLASQGYRYIGVDISVEMMRRLRERLAQDTPVSLLRGDATALPLRDASVDGAITVHVFHLIAGWELAVAELQRVIRPGGILAVGFNDVGELPPAERLRERWRATCRAAPNAVRRAPPRCPRHLAAARKPARAARHDRSAHALRRLGSAGADPA